MKFVFTTQTHKLKCYALERCTIYYNIISFFFFCFVNNQKFISQWRLGTESAGSRLGLIRFLIRMNNYPQSITTRVTLPMPFFRFSLSILLRLLRQPFFRAAQNPLCAPFQFNENRVINHCHESERTYESSAGSARRIFPLDDEFTANNVREVLIKSEAPKNH